MASKLRQTIPRRKATVSLDNKTLKHSLAVHFQSYPLALAKKDQLSTASAVFGIYDSTQSAMPIPVMQTAEPIRRKAESIRQNIRFRNTKCIQSDHSILGVQGLVNHIMEKDFCRRCKCLVKVVQQSRTLCPKLLKKKSISFVDKPMFINFGLHLV